MKVDNKIIAFTGRNEGEIECIFTIDEPTRKDIAWCGGTDLPRCDEDDGNVLARMNYDPDYSQRRDDTNLISRDPIGDFENNLFDEDYHININREVEQPDMYMLEDWEYEPEV